MKTLFDNPEYEWRETLFVLFDGGKHPPLTYEQLQTLATEDPFSFLEITSPRYTPEGLLKRALFLSPETHSAVEIQYRQGRAVLEQSMAFYESTRAILDDDERRLWQKILHLSSCYELVYFEKPDLKSKVAAPMPDVLPFEPEDMTFYDPGTLLFLMEKLTQRTCGAAVDPQSGMILEIET